MNRKSNYFLFLLALCIYNPSASQSRWGIHGGVNISSILPPITTATYHILGSSYDVSSSRTGFYAGVSSEFKLSNYTNLMLECDYAKKGYKVTRNVTGFREWVTNTTTQIGYLELGCNFMYGLPLGSGKMSIGVGPKFGYTLSGESRSITASIRYDYLNSDTTMNISKRIVPEITSLLKYEFDLGLFFEIRFDYMFKAQPDVNLGVFEIGMGYTFRLKSKRK